MNDMDDMDDKLIQMLRASGAEQCNSAGTLFMVSVKDAAAYRSAILADAAKDVEPVGEVMLGYSTELEKCYPDGPMNHVHWNEKSAVPCAGSDIYSASTVASLASTLAAAQALNAELVARVEGVEKDAARYRWLRDGEVSADYPYPVMRTGGIGLGDRTIWAEELDDAIDVALAAKGQA